ncbi:YcaO-like family protein [Dermatophilaceae bacterium Soc4.6]
MTTTPTRPPVATAPAPAALTPAALTPAEPTALTPADHRPVPQHSRAQSTLGALPQLDRLVGPLGVVGSIRRLPTFPGDPAFPIHVASLGDLSPVAPNIAEAVGGIPTRAEMDGAGGALDPERARRVGVAEALERYASCIVDTTQLTWATARELGDDAVDLTSFPQCSATELSRLGGPVTPVDIDGRQRWVKGWSLTRAEPCWVPAAAVWMRLAPRTPAERFTSGISTGCAAHSDLASAVLGGLCEVIERDSIALTWLQRIPWPRLEIDWDDAVLRPFAERHARSNVEVTVFDATTDLGVPTFYSLERTPHHRTLTQLVMCNTSLDPVDSVAKMLREAASSRIALQADRVLPEQVSDYTNVFHGAVHMGRPEQAGAFDFLRSGTTSRRLVDVPHLATGDSLADLALVTARLAHAGYEVLVVELTTDEARDAGFRVVRVVVPGLMPLSFVHGARYLAHPRLYDAPARLGYPVHAEADLNHDPQPFA